MVFFFPRRYAYVFGVSRATWSFSHRPEQQDGVPAVPRESTPACGMLVAGAAGMLMVQGMLMAGCSGMHVVQGWSRCRDARGTGILRPAVQGGSWHRGYLQPVVWGCDFPGQGKVTRVCDTG